MTLFLTLTCLLPLVFGGSVLLVSPPRRNRLVTPLAEGVAALSLLAAVVCAGLVVFTGPSSFAAMGLTLRLDPVGVVFAVVISFVGLVIVRFSGGYLEGEARQPAFLGLLLLTLLFAQLLALAGDVFVLGLAWVGMSVPVQKLLTYYPRPGAMTAARLKFGFARASDLSLFAALGLLVASTGVTDIAAIGAAADASAPIVAVATLLLTVAILLRSAQVPTHSWLLRAIEAPTPVSAVLHAGVVNAGGLPALRFAPVLAASPAAMTLLAAVSGLSMLIALGAMAGEDRIKSRLAWSTVAQMGFMLLQCSLGLFGLALLHIAAHALYKSFAFLNAGTLVPVRAVTAPSWSGGLVAILAFALVAIAATPLVTLDAASLAIGTIFVLGLAHVGAGGKERSGLLWRGAGSAAAAVLWLGLHQLAWLLLPFSPVQFGPLTVVVAIVATISLAMLVVGTPLRETRLLKALRVHIRNGLYIDLLVERLVRPRADTSITEAAK